MSIPASHLTAALSRSASEPGTNCSGSKRFLPRLLRCAARGWTETALARLGRQHQR